VVGVVDRRVVRTAQPARHRTLSVGSGQSPTACRSVPPSWIRGDVPSLPGNVWRRPRRIHLARRPVKLSPYWQYPQLQESPLAHPRSETHCPP
jgi:hypothetical protein